MEQVLSRRVLYGFVALALAAMAFLTAAAPAMADDFGQKSINSYTYSSIGRPVGGQWVNSRYEVNGQRVTGIQYIDGEYYGFSSTGLCNLTGEVLVEGKRFYFKNGRPAEYCVKGQRSSSGSPISYQYDIDFIGVAFFGDYYGVHYRTDGVIESGFITFNDKLRYVDPETGYIVFEGLYQVDGGGLIYADNCGALAQNEWKQIDGTYYYFGSDGIAYRGTHTIDGGVYVFNNQTSALTSASVAVPASTSCYNRYFGPSGGATAYEDGFFYTVTGGSSGSTGSHTAVFTLRDTSVLHWIDGSTTPKRVTWTSTLQPDGWAYVEKGWCYFTNGQAYCNHGEDVLINGKWYNFGNGGYYMRTGIYVVMWNDNREDCVKNYGENGARTTGWATDDNGNTYYFDPNNEGWAVRGTKVIDGMLCEFDRMTCHLISASVAIPNSSRLIFSGTEKTAYADNALYTVSGGCATEVGEYEAVLTLVNSGATTWADGTTEPKTVSWSIIYVGWQQDAEGNWRYYDNDGVYVTGWRKISSKWYYFGEDGSMATGLTSVPGEGTYVLDASGQPLSGWNKVGDSWYYSASNGLASTGWKQLGSKKYWFDADGVMATGILSIEGEGIYAFDVSGAMVYGWQADSTETKWLYMGSSGAALLGLQAVGGKTYYFDQAEGWMQIGVIDVDGTQYCFGDDGVMVIDQWYSNDSKTYYAGHDGKAVTGDQEIEGVVYTFDNEGVLQPGARIPVPTVGTMIYDGTELTAIAGTAFYTVESGSAVRPGTYTATVTLVDPETFVWADGTTDPKVIEWTMSVVGWYQDDEGSWYYAKENGELQNGWFKSGAKWYWFDNDGKMATGIMVIEGEGTYAFGSNGVMVSGWQQDVSTGEWYYMGAGSKAVTGWQQINSKWYWFDSEGIMATGMTEIGGEMYCFASGGAMQTGWIKTADGRWMCTKSASSGILMKNCWMKGTDGKWYWVCDDYIMANSCKMDVEGDTYIFDAGGKMQTGWVQWEGEWYVSASSTSGKLKKNAWVKSGSYWYWLDENGVMVHDCELEIDGKTYSFDSKGHML